MAKATASLLCWRSLNCLQERSSLLTASLQQGLCTAWPSSSLNPASPTSSRDLSTPSTGAVEWPGEASRPETALTSTNRSDILQGRCWVKRRGAVVHARDDQTEARRDAGLCMIDAFPPKVQSLHPPRPETTGHIIVTRLAAQAHEHMHSA